MRVKHIVEVLSLTHDIAIVGTCTGGAWAWAVKHGKELTPCATETEARIKGHALHKQVHESKGGTR